MYSRITDFSHEWPNPLWLIEVLKDGKYLFVVTARSMGQALERLEAKMENHDGQ